MATSGVVTSPPRGPLGPFRADTAVMAFGRKAGTQTVANLAATETFYNDTDQPLYVQAVRATVGTAPTGTSLIVDVLNDGTTIYTTQANRPTIAISGTTALGGTAANNKLLPGKALTFTVAQIGNSVAGSDLVIQCYLSTSI